MPSLTITLPEDIENLVNMIVEYTGRSRSSVCADLIKDAAYREIESLKCIEGFKVLLRKNRISE